MLRRSVERPCAAPLGLPPDRRLSPSERARLLGEILAAYASVSFALRRAPIETVVAGLRELSPPRRSAGAATAADCRRLGTAVARTLAPLPGDTRCLVRSLVLTRLLARRGIATRIVIATRSSPVFLAHAWVEHAGAPVLDPGDGSFTRLTEL